MLLKVNPAEIANFVTNKFEKKMGKLVDFVKDSIDQKVDSVDQKVDSVDQKVYSVNQKLDSFFNIEKKLGNIMKKFIERFKNADTQSHTKYPEPIEVYRNFQN